MFISRPAVLAIAMASVTGSAAAQSSIDRNPASLLQQFETQQFKAPDDSSHGIRVDQFRLPLNDGPERWVSKPEIRDQLQARTCYTMRRILVRRDDPGSDATSVAGYSTCQPASRFQVKSAVQPSAPRILELP